MRRLALVFFSLMALIIALIPFWFWLGIKHMAHPQGFWQNMLVIVVLGIPLGLVQIILLVLWVAFLCSLWEE